MKTVDKIYKAIKKNSDYIIHHSDEWTKELAGSKNYICTPDLKHWTFGKSVGDDGEYHYSGGVAKNRLYTLGFRNVLAIEKNNETKTIIEAFNEWAAKVKDYPIKERFEKDQKGNKRFELLVHEDELKHYSANIKKKGNNTSQKLFDEGFKKQIVRELSYRDPKVVQLAKSKHGTKCIVCKFDFTKTYGSHGEGFIEMHHLFPIALGKRKTTVDDLRPVCANCHRMLHRGKELLSIDELKQIIANNNKIG